VIKVNYIERRIRDLFQYRPEPTMEPDEIDRYWDAALRKFAAKPLNDTVRKEEHPFKGADVFRVAYEGYDDTPVHGWYLLPSFLQRDSYPCVVMYQGYTADSGEPERYAAWLLLGFAVFAVDTRGQGGETGSRLSFDHGVVRGWVSQNITVPERSYYMAIAIDAWKAVEWVARRPEIDSSMIAVAGGSQGGGLSLLTAALNDKVRYAIADIPNMCHMDFGVMNSTGSLSECAQFVKRYPDRLQDVLRTLAHFDIMNLGHRIRIPVRMSVGLKDMICWPETVFAAYNRIASEDKAIDVHPFCGHEVWESQTRKHMRWLDSLRST
jgi:cephalosporin-C deacetylase